MPTEFKFPDVGEGITEGEIVKWRVREGDMVKEHDVLAEIETDKAIVEIPSPVSGTILQLHHKEGDTVKVGEILVTIGDKSEKPAPVIKPAGAVGYLEEAPDEIPARPVPIQVAVPAGPIVSATPVIRRLARDLGVDILRIKGSGFGGRITEEDVRNFAQGLGMKNIEENLPEVEIKIQKKYDMYGYVERVQLKGVRKAIAKHMVESIYTIPHVTHMDEVDVTRLFRHREREKKIAESRGIKLTYLPFIIKSCIAALKKHPGFNSSLDEQHEEIVMKKYYNIGIAVDSENGLMVPVIKGADQKNIFQLAREIVELAEKVKSREVDLGDLKGGTFTITNIGSLGGIFATPIINHPEVAILAVGRITDRLVVDKEGKIKIRKILPLSLAFDHRVVDGADAAEFMNSVKELLEDPDLLMMQE